MFTAREIAEFRADAESRMGAGNSGSTATVWREDPDNPTVVAGLQVPSWTDEHTNLPRASRWLSRGAAQTRTVSIGQTEVQLAVREWHCPAATLNLADGDVIEITAGENVGLFLRVVEVTWQDQATARRLPVVEIQKPEGL